MTGKGAADGALYFIQAPNSPITPNQISAGPPRAHAGATKLHLTSSKGLPTSLGAAL